MSKKNYSVARVVTHTQSTIGKCERHNERKNESYANMNVDTTRCNMNVHFRDCGELTYNEQLNKLISEKKVCMRGLKADAKVFDEVIFDVNTDYFETHGGYEYAKEFYEEAYRFAVNLYGEQNIISAVMHADELNVALTEQYGKPVYHYHMHLVALPAVEKQILWTKRCKDKSLVGTVKEIVNQISHSKKWKSPQAVDENGNVVFNEKGKPVLIPSYSILQDDFFNHILENMQYTGCTINFKSTTVSFKVHKTVYNDAEDWVIIPNTQEPIIDMDTWERVQEINKHRRRNTATGRQSIFSGLVYCGDCGSKLYFCAAKSIKEHQEFFRCSAYKENRGSCSIHYIRNVVLEKMVLKTIREAAEYITEYEPVFLYLFANEHRLSIANNLKEAKYELEKNKKRIQELDKLIEAVFEQNVLGKLPDDRYNRMLTNYENEQKDLMQKVEDAEKLINTAQQENIDVRNFLANIRQCTDIKELTPSTVNKLIDKIEVFDRVIGEDGKKHVPIKIHFVGVGVIQFPDAEMLEKTKEEMKAYAKKAS